MSDWRWMIDAAAPCVPVQSPWCPNNPTLEYLPIEGGTMQGPLILAHDPVQPLEAATKEYVDAILNSPAFTGTPTAPTPSPTTINNQLATTAYVHAAIAQGGTFVDAPADGTTYGRLNNNWAAVLPLSGGAMTGPLSWISTNSTALRSAQDRTAEQVNVRDFGAKGDGTTDDTAAIQAAVNKGGTIRFPTGRYLISAAIVSPNTGPITVIGDGLNASIILQTTAGANGWVHTSTQFFQMFGLSLMCNGVGGTAIKANFSGGTVSFFTLRDVQIIGNGNQTSNFWHDGIIANAASVTTLDHVFVTGTNNGPLANIGNGIYLTPPLAPAADTGSYVFWINNSNIGYYQTGIVLDSTGHTANLQGVVLEWVNCNYCMQFVKVLGTILELNILHCQYEGMGSAFHGEGADTLVIRDCLFFCSPNPTMAIAAQLPQDVFYASGGGNWWIKDNRIILSPSAVASWIFNITGAFNPGAFRDNVIWTQSATCSGMFNIASTAANVTESGTQTEFWNNAWPKWVNGNAAAGNTCQFGALQTAGAISGTQWQNQGLTIGWNYAGTGPLGEADFINSHGGGGGGFNFYNVASSASATPTLLAFIDPSGNMDLPSGSITATACVSNIASVATSVSPITGTQWAQQGSWTAFNYGGGSGLNGEFDFINSRGGGTGGFAWFSTPSSSSATPALAATLNPAGTFTASRYVGTQAGGGTGAAFVSQGAGGAGYTWYDPTAAADAKLFDILAASGTIYFRLLLDNQSNFNDFLTVTRTGDVPTTVNLSGTNIGLQGAVTANSINNTPIGATTPSTGAFTTIAASGAVSGAGFTALLAPYAPLANPTFTGTTTVAGLTATGTVSGAGFTNLFASPPAIGGTAAAAGTFTSVTGQSGTFTTGAGSLTANTVVSEIADCVASLASISGTQWQQQGAWTAWNYQGSSGLNGETDFINSRGGGLGGFAWFTTLSTTGATPTLLAKMDNAGNFSTAGFLTVMGNLATILPPTGLSGSIGWNYLSGPGETDYWSDYTSGTMSHVFWQRTASSATRLMSIDPTGNAIVNGFITTTSNQVSVLPPGYASTSAFTVGGNFLSGPAEVDYWNCYTGSPSVSHTFWQRTSGGETRLMDIGPTGLVTAYNGIIGSYIAVGAGGPTWTTGTTAPSSTQPVGSIYSRVGGAVGATFYVSRGGGTWAAVSGV